MSAPPGDPPLDTRGARAPLGDDRWRGPARGVARALTAAGVLAHAAFLSISVAGMQIGLGVALAGLVLLRASGERAWQRSALDLPILTLIGAAIASLGLGTLGGSAPVGLFEATLWRSLVAPIVLVSALRSGRDAESGRRLALLALLVWSAAALVPSAVAVAQYFTGVDPLHALGLRRQPVRAVVPIYPDRFAAVGFFRWYQRLAHNLLPPLALAAGVAVHAAGLGRRARALLLAGALAASLAVVLTLSRAAWVTLLLAWLAVVLPHPRVRRVGVPLVVAAAVALLALPVVRTRLAYMREPGGAADRVNIWEVCGAVIHDHPLTGVGWGNYPQRSLPYYERFPKRTEMRAWCHDSFLSAWAEGGPLLFAALCAFWLLLARAGWRWSRSAGEDGLARGAAVGVLAAILASFTSALLHDILYSSEAVYGLGFALGVAAAIGGIAQRSDAAARP